MSVSLTLVPVALALRVVMGKDKFNNWIESSQEPQISNFKSRKELTSTVQRAGYDAIPYGSSIKTHFNDKNFFFWELREGKWVAVFSQYDDRGLIKTFIKKLNEAAKRDVFSTKQTEEIAQIDNSPSIKRNTIFPTNFTDIELLAQVLSEKNIPTATEQDGSLVSILKATTLRFIQHRPDGVIDVELADSDSLANTFHQLTLLDEDYRKLIQQETYAKVVENAEQKGFTIEEEMVLPDESILLTLRVGE